MSATNIGFILMCLNFIATVEANNVQRVKRNLNSGPHNNSTRVQHHQFLWNLPSVAGGRRFEDTLKSSLVPSDFLYIFTGDTQHWHPCTGENSACHRATNFCLTDKRVNGRDCHQKQSEFSNKLQQISMTALNRRLISDEAGKTPILGLIINGDLTEFGHDDELDRLEKLWTSGPFDNMIKVYPGLGNHDYANNVGDCTFDRCADRMLRWFRSYVKDTLKLPLDLRTTTKYLIFEDNTGSIAYSWDECPSPSRCFHFIQLNNYPTYARHVDGWRRDWKILSSINWLKNDLRRQAANKSVIINFHDFDTSFTMEDKSKFRAILDNASRSHGIRILAIFFAHFHHMVGLKEWWCIDGRRVPLIYSGSVPGNNYVVAHFSTMNGNMKKLYSVHVDSEIQSSVEIEAVPERQESCT